MRHPVAVAAARRLGRGFLASTPELAAMAALPQDLAVPGLDRAHAKPMPAPVAVPTGGRGAAVERSIYQFVARGVGGDGLLTVQTKRTLLGGRPRASDRRSTRRG